ncbi:MAG: energy transducer TonB [Gammaproteobacteria bacterium]|nr:energy transducer TonB [Gammaproteobacteria bacterium]
MFLLLAPGDFAATRASRLAPWQPLAVTLSQPHHPEFSRSGAAEATASLPAPHNDPVSIAEPTPGKTNLDQDNAATIGPHPSGLFPGPWYYTSRYLHRNPTPLKPIWPHYPATAENFRGRVTILLLINESGEIDQYRITDAEPAGIFEPSVIAAFIQARFAPGLITGSPVKSQLLAEVLFEPGAAPQAKFSILEVTDPLQGKSRSPAPATQVPSARGN